MMNKTEKFYYREMLKRAELSEIQKWLKKCPRPVDFQGGDYAWAYTEMVVIPIPFLGRICF